MQNPPAEPIRDFRRREIGTLLRSRRLAIRPEDVDLPKASGRRSVGLRMEDVAELAGVSLSWYARFEAGHDITMSTRTLAAVTRVLRMSPYETAHLFTLTATPILPRPEGREPFPIAEIRAIVEGCSGAVAVAVDHRYDLIVANATASFLFGFRGDEAGFERNCVWRMFALSAYRSLHRDDWETQARRMVDHLRTAYAKYYGDSHLEALICELSNHWPEFSQLWLEPATEPPSGVRLFVNTGNGRCVPVDAAVVTTVPSLYQETLISYFILRNSADVRLLNDLQRRQDLRQPH